MLQTLSNRLVANVIRRDIVTSRLRNPETNDLSKVAFYFFKSSKPGGQSTPPCARWLLNSHNWVSRGVVLDHDTITTSRRRHDDVTSRRRHWCSPSNTRAIPTFEPFFVSSLCSTTAATAVSAVGVGLAKPRPRLVGSQSQSPAPRILATSHAAK